MGDSMKAADDYYEEAWRNSPEGKALLERRKRHKTVVSELSKARYVWTLEETSYLLHQRKLTSPTSNDLKGVEALRGRLVQEGFLAP